jgi:sugar O-acyltransferase (sialic acid O-acetyltransferase NeuD family)
MADALQPLVIVGASGFGREVACLVEDINAIQPKWNLLGLVDDNLKNDTIEGFNILGTVKDIYLMEPRPMIVVAIADPPTKKRLAESFKADGFKFATLIHPTVSIGKKVTIGEGTIICRNTLFTTNIDIGEHCIINVNCSFGHDTKVEDYVSIMSHTAIAGDVLVGSGCYFGLNCTVINKISLGEWSTYGAGTVVVRNMPTKIVAVGSPAKIIRSKE